MQNPRTAVEKRSQQATKSTFVRQREKWLQIVKDASFDTYVVRPKSTRSPTKTIYFVSGSANAWLDKMEKEFERLATLARASNAAPTSRSRILWIPTLIRNPIALSVRLSRARSVRTITKDQARDFVRKSGTPIDLPEGKFFISSNTGYAYSLHATYANAGSMIFTFPEWCVCLGASGIYSVPTVKVHVNERIGKVATRLDRLRNGERSGRDIRLCEYNGNVLFVRAVDEDGWD